MPHYVLSSRTKTNEAGGSFGRRATFFGQRPCLIYFKSKPGRYLPHEGFKQAAKAIARATGQRWQDVYSPKVGAA